jgi:hypothetical protein
MSAPVVSAGLAFEEDLQKERLDREFAGRTSISSHLERGA